MMSILSVYIDTFFKIIIKSSTTDNPIDPSEKFESEHRLPAVRSLRTNRVANDHRIIIAIIIIIIIIIVVVWLKRCTMYRGKDSKQNTFIDRPSRSADARENFLFGFIIITAFTRCYYCWNQWARGPLSIVEFDDVIIVLEIRSTRTRLRACQVIGRWLRTCGCKGYVSPCI